MPCTSSILQEKQSELNLSPTLGVFSSPWMDPSSMGLGPLCPLRAQGVGGSPPLGLQAGLEGLGPLSVYTLP